MVLPKKKTNTITVSNKSMIMAYVVTALMLSTAAIYFIAASQDYSKLSQTVSSSSSGSTTNNTTEGKDQGDITATRNEMIFFIVVGVGYVAVGIWILKNKHHSKVTYFIATIGSIALIAFYISTRTINIPPIGLQDDVGTMDILAKVMQAAIAAISIYIIRSSTIRRRPLTTSQAAETILEYEEQKSQKRNKTREKQRIRVFWLRINHNIYL
jgi:hypothetical protein